MSIQLSFGITLMKADLCTNRGWKMRQVVAKAKCDVKGRGMRAALEQASKAAHRKGGVWARSVWHLAAVMLAQRSEGVCVLPCGPSSVPREAV